MMVALIVLIAALTFEVLLATSVSRLPMIWLLAAMFTAPADALSVTLLVPALMTAEPPPTMLPRAALMLMSPVAVTFAGSMTMPLASKTVRLPAVMVAVRFVTLVLSDEELEAEMLSVLPITWAGTLLSVILPLDATPAATLSVTLPTPAPPLAALMTPEPVRL